MPVTIASRTGKNEFTTDEHVKVDTTLDTLATLKAAFGKEADRVTVGNASGLRDSASSLVLATGEAVRTLGRKPLPRLMGYAHSDMDPQLMGIDPVPASREAQQRAGMAVSDMDVIESNKTFAAHACAVDRLLACVPTKVNNSNDSGISLDHPVGTVFATKAIHELRRIQRRYALAIMCIGGEQDIAALFEHC